jgi:large subunit ribosomal protein L15
MTKRRSKKNKSGSHGYGSSKKNRGAGNRGGKGNAGSGKKAQSKRLTKEGVQELGERGFNSRKPEQNAINLRDIDQRIDDMVEEGLVDEDGGKLVLDLDDIGYEKVLGKGHLNREVEIHAESFSGSAERKIEEADGEAVQK